MHEEVKQTKTRSGWLVSRTLQALGVARSSYYRWLREKPWSRKEPGELVRVVQAFEVLAREKRAVRDYALAHPEVRHRELSWRMIDEDVACLSASTVYRILREQRLMASWSRRKKRYREEREQASRPDEIRGDRPDVRKGERSDVLLRGVHRRILAIHCAPRAAHEHGRGDAEPGGAAGGGDTAADRDGRAGGEAGVSAATTGAVTSRRNFTGCWSITD